MPLQNLFAHGMLLKNHYYAPSRRSGIVDLFMALEATRDGINFLNHRSGPADMQSGESLFSVSR